MAIEYEFEVGRIKQEIKKTGARFICLQFPEGLKEHAIEVIREIEDNSEVDVVVFTDPIYGACDTKDAEAERLGVDLIIHFGHTDFI